MLYNELEKSFKLFLKDNDIVKVLAKKYAEHLSIDESVATEIVKNKFRKHHERIGMMLQEGLKSGVIEKIEKAKDISIEEYLKEKPVIKG